MVASVTRRRLVGYGRVSTEEQESNFSLDAQRSRFEFLCQHNGWQSVGFFQETGSGTSIRGRPVLQDVLHLVQQGKVNALWVRETDRLTRPEHLGDISTIAEVLESTNTVLIVDTQEYDLSEDASVLMLDFQGIFAKYFRRQLLRNMSRGKTRKAELGRKAGGADIFGYVTNEAGEYQPHPEQARVVRLIFNLAIRGLTVRQIARELEARAISTASGKRKWGHGVVAGILRNDIYMGIYRFQKSKKLKDKDGSIFKGRPEEQIVVGTKADPNHPPIVEPWVFDAVQEKLNAGKKNKSKQLHMATGVLLCPVCRNRMSVKYSSGPRKLGQKIEKYVCSRKPSCSSPRLPVADLNRILWEKLNSLFLQPEQVHSLLTGNSQEYGRSCQRQLEEKAIEEKGIEAKKEKLLDLYLDGELSKTIYTSKTEQLDQRLNVLRKEKEEIQTKLQQMSQVDMAAELIHTLRILARSHKRFTEDQKTRLFRALVKEANIRDDRVELEMYVEPVQNIWWKYRQKSRSSEAIPLLPSDGAPRHVRNLLRMRS